MDWGTVANLIVGIGLPAAEDIIQRWETGTPVTLADFQAIRDKANQTAQDRMKAAITNAGFTLDDPRVQALLGLTSAPAVIPTPVPAPAPEPPPPTVTPAPVEQGPPSPTPPA